MTTKFKIQMATNTSSNRESARERLVKLCSAESKTRFML